MNLPPDLLAARGYLAVARGDRDKGFYLSACLTAQKSAEVALQSYIRVLGMDASAESLPVLLAGLPGRTSELERASVELDRFRMNMYAPYRSASDPVPDATPEAAAACCSAAEAIVAHVDRLFEHLAAEAP